MRRIFAILVLATLSGFPASMLSAVIQEKGAVYLEGLLREMPELPLRKPVAIYYDIGFQRFLGTLRAPQQIELQAFSDNGFRVVGMARQGQVVGWVPRDQLPDVDPDFLDAVAKAAERERKVAKLIESKEIAMGMTPDEVRASIGKPEKKSTRVSRDGRTEVWEYITYKNIPQQRTGYDRFGRLMADTVYVKVPDGSMTVVFENGVVAEIEKSEGTLYEGGASIVVPPINLVW